MVVVGVIALPVFGLLILAGLRGVIRVSLAGLIGFVLMFVLFAPLECAHLANHVSHTSCSTLLGLRLPGFAGEGDFSPSYVGPMIAATAGFASGAMAATKGRRKA